MLLKWEKNIESATETKYYYNLVAVSPCMEALSAMRGPAAGDEAKHDPEALAI